MGDLRALVKRDRNRVAQTINRELVLLHWQIGQHIRTDILQEERAEYGDRVVEALNHSPTAEYGRSISRRSLFNRFRFAE